MKKIMKILFMQISPPTYNFLCSSALQPSPVTDIFKIHCQNVQDRCLCHSKALSNEQAMAMFEWMNTARLQISVWLSDYHPRVITPSTVTCVE